MKLVFLSGMFLIRICEERQCKTEPMMKLAGNLC